MVELINEPRLDLACGNNKREDFKGIDIVKTDSTDYVFDLQQYPWPIESESVEEINCSHYIEHIKHDNVALDIKNILDKCSTFEEFKEKINSPEFLQPKDGFIKFMNEIYRILKPGGKVHIVAPYYASMRAIGDPTHIRSIGDSTCWYLSKDWMNGNKLQHYGMDCNFDVKISYYITNEITLKSEEVRRKAFMNDWNVIDDIIIDLIKK